MRVTGSMENMMDMESRLGPEGADIEANIGKALGMDLGFIGFIPEMFMQVSGLMGRVMDVEFILVRMGADMLANLSGGSSMALAITISEMGTHMLENILRTRCMDLVSIVLPMGIGMKEPGMRVEDRGLECTHSEMGKPNLVTGKMEFSIFQARRIRLILYHLLQFTTPKYSMRCRKHDEQLKKLMMWPR